MAAAVVSVDMWISGPPQSRTKGTKVGQPLTHIPTDSNHKKNKACRLTLARPAPNFLVLFSKKDCFLPTDTHAPRKLRPPPGPLRLLTQRRRHKTRQDRPTRTRSRHAGCGHHRFRQSVWRAGVLAILRGPRRAADRRLPDRPGPGRWRTRSGGPARPERGGAGQFAAALLGRLPDRRSRRAAACLRCHGGTGRGFVPADRWHTRPGRAAAGRGAGGRCRGAAGPDARGFRRTDGGRAAPARHGTG